ncbi:MAG: nicotinate-nucleotide adenylyltransferase, partial [Desulfurococcales archaeon]|nr:nicotinate-nucleotide adenylyltransferase [Desulfurococcales archaeon]
YLEMLLPPFHAVVSGNPLVQILFEDSGYEVFSPPMFSRSKCSGTRIRRTVIEGGVWEECVPEIILDDLLEIGFAERLKRLSRGDE